MRRLFDILVDSLKEVQPNFVALGLGLFAVITLFTLAGVVGTLTNGIVEIVQAITGAVSGSVQ